VPRIGPRFLGASHLQTTVVGSYPRVSDTPEGQRLRRAIARWERKELSDGDLRKVQVDVLQEVVREQAGAGVDLVSDGQVTWHDPVSHFAAKLEGFEIGGLLRYFDTNTYYRQPKARGKVRWVNPITVDDWVAASSAAPSSAVKAVIIGPYTLASLSANGPTHDLLWDLAVALGNEVNTLAHSGAPRIQIDEPALTRAKSLPKEYDEIVDTLLEARGRAEVTLFTCFGGVGHLLEDLEALPFDYLGLDLVQGASTLEALRKRPLEKPVIAGLLDARNTRIEAPREVAKRALALADSVPMDRSWLSPSNGLEFLPRTKAREKLRVLVSAAKLVREAVA